MRGSSTLALTLAVTSALGGCAGSRSGDAAHGEQVLSWRDVERSRSAEIVAEQPAPAPAGLVAFCARMQAMCGAGGGVVNFTLKESATSHHAAVWQTGAQGSPSAWTGVAGEDGAAIFSRLLAVRAQGGVFYHRRNDMALTETRWRQLRTVNRDINREIVATTDANNRGLGEYWSMPISERTDADGAVLGDCEDFVLEKRERLISLGWDRQALALAVAHSPETGLHAVLIAQTDRGDFVLDNLHDEPLAPQSLNYTWVSRQSGPALTVWATARAEAAPSVWDQGLPLLQASHEGGANGQSTDAPNTVLSSIMDAGVTNFASARLIPVAGLAPILEGPRSRLDAVLVDAATSFDPLN